jgi:hypothetical protein
MLKLLSCIVIVTTLSGCASLYHQIVPNSRGRIVEIRTDPPNTDIYLSSEIDKDGNRLDSIICSGTPCQVYVEPEYWITLKKKGYRTEQVSTEQKRSLAYYIITPLMGGIGYLALTELLHINSAISAVIVLASATVSAIIDVKNPNTKIVDNLKAPIRLQLLDENLAKQGEIERKIRDEKEALERNNMQKNSNSIPLKK